FLADVIDVANHIPTQNGYDDAVMKDIVDTVSKYYIRIIALDKPGVMSKVTGVLGQEGISLVSVVQKETLGEYAEIVLITHNALTKNLFDALDEIEKLKEVDKVASVIRVEGEE
ncbi:ACT domain-containing protein, partial [Thermoanaerobacterium aotearoense]|uniref:ACT domain-containing protein n=1 Tax=Thermoanaerobacterium aotearoense TaxID=47490 RepID=UPI00056E03B7